MIIFISAIVYTVQVIVQHCNSLNLIDLPQSRDDFSATWKLASRAPEMYEPYPRQIGMKSYVRRYMLGNDRTTDNRRFKASRRVFEDEKDVNLKNKLSALVKQAMHDTEEKMKEVDPVKEKHADEPPYKAGFVLSMVKKSREVLNELFNVAIKHRDEWQALEQLKIFEMIVNTNVDTNHLLKLLQDIEAGREPKIYAEALKTTEKRIEVTTQATRISNNEIKVEIENDTDSKVE